MQDGFTAQADSAVHLTSNYRSLAYQHFSCFITFKFCLNEKDNELPTGQDHWLVIGEEHQSPIIRFGEAPEDVPAAPIGYLPVNYRYTFRLDLSPVLKQFEEKGYYEAYNGDHVAREDFKGVYLAGSADPLTWDFVRLAEKGLKLQASEEPGIYTLTVILNPHNSDDTIDHEWRPTLDLSDKPSYTSDQPIVDALFNLSLEEAIKNIEPDFTLRTGAEWAGVWTRDISYSILLAFAYHEPEIAKISLRKKVKRGRTVQDTGSGGAWPVSTDRTTWVLAAWEVFLVTGDEAWLDEIYPVIKNTLDDDFKTIYNEATGLFSGESSFLDWREQTYPKWMSNADIYVSECLATNVVHFRAHQILAQIAERQGESPEPYRSRAEGIKNGINEYLWLEDAGYYAQFLYGRPDLLPSPRFEALGEALAILYGVADEQRAASIIARSPLTPFGATCIYPQIPDIPPYHNNGIWPFVQSFWNLAGAQVQNESVLVHGLASVYRAAGLFLSNYENMVAETGDYAGTEINSRRMLWSMAGNLAMVHRVFMGMRFEPEGMYLEPVVPAAFKGKKSLKNFRYRQATLDISLTGHGRTISRILVNGTPVEKAFIAGDLTGHHTVEIELDNQPFPHQEIHAVANHFSLPAPHTAIVDDVLQWKAIVGALSYRVYQNGKLVAESSGTSYPVPVTEPFAIYQVSAVDEQGYESFTSKPLEVATDIRVYELENFAPASELPYTDFTGSGFVTSTKSENASIELSVTVEAAGIYLLNVRYANGNGPLNTGNQCAIRSLYVDDTFRGVLVFPQRGEDEWSDWGWSNARQVELRAGSNTVRISYEPWNENMNGGENRVMLDCLRIIPR